MNKPKPRKPTLEQIIKEHKRELGVRKRIFPRWVADPYKKFTQYQMDHRIACMEDTIEILENIQGKQSKLF